MVYDYDPKRVSIMVGPGLAPPVEQVETSLGYDPSRLSVTAGDVDLLEVPRQTVRDLGRLSLFGMSRSEACQQALLEQERYHLAFEPQKLGTWTTPRYRVTRRCNVYDDLERRSVWATWGLGSIRERIELAQAKADELNATTPGITHTGPTAEQIETARAGWRKRWPEGAGPRGPVVIVGTPTPHSSFVAATYPRGLPSEEQRENDRRFGASYLSIDPGTGATTSVVRGQVVGRFPPGSVLLEHSTNGVEHAVAAKLRQHQQSVQDLCALFDGPTPPLVLAAYLDWRPTRRLLIASDITLDTLLGLYPNTRERRYFEAGFARGVFTPGESYVADDGVVTLPLAYARPTPLAMPGILSIRGRLPDEET